MAMPPNSFSQDEETEKLMKETLNRYKITMNACNKRISELHLQEISERCCEGWQLLPSHLDMPEKDTEHEVPKESEQRRCFLNQWEEAKGSDATYKKLIYSLLQINSRKDAEKICEMIYNDNMKTVNEIVPGNSQPSADAAISTTATGSRPAFENSIVEIEEPVQAVHYRRTQSLRRRDSKKRSNTEAAQDFQYNAADPFMYQDVKSLRRSLIFESRRRGQSLTDEDDAGTPDLLHQGLESTSIEISSGIHLVIGTSPQGPCAKKILNSKHCPDLQVGDILWKLNEEDVRFFSTDDLSAKLKNTKAATLHVLRLTAEVVSLKKAVIAGDAELVNAILQETDLDIDVCRYNYRNSYFSALMIASEKGNVEVAIALISHGANAKKTTQDGLSSLMIASRCGHYEMVKLLLKCSDLNAQDNNGWSALMYACRERYGDIVKLLLDNNADADLQNEKKWTSLMIASEKDSSIVGHLLMKNADVDIQKDDGGYALHIASTHGNHEAVKHLIKSNATVDVKNSKGRTPLMNASEEGNKDVIKLLIESNANVNLQDVKGHTALMLSSEAGHFEETEMLLNSKADIGIQSHKGESALSLAMTSKDPEIIKAIVDHISNKTVELENDDTEFASNGCDVIPFSLNALNLIKWKDKNSDCHDFFLPALTSKMWRRIGHELNYTDEMLDAIKQKQVTDELCWFSIMEEWLENGSSSFSASWKSLYDILVKIGERDVARQLRTAVTHAIYTDEGESSPEAKPTGGPLFNEVKQQLLFSKTMPKPAKQNKEVLQDFCTNIAFLFLVGSKNEYQAAVTVMDPPKGTLFERAVVYPKQGFVVGMIADKATAVIHEHPDCSSFVQDVFEFFPNARFVASIGAGYAYDSELVELGDVLISDLIIDGKTKDRTVQVLSDLKTTFCYDLTYDFAFSVTDTQRKSKQKSGKLVFGPQTVPGGITPEAIGGDNKSSELLSFESMNTVKGVIVMKGVSYYYAESKASAEKCAEKWEFTASKAAFEYARKKLEYYYSDPTPPTSPMPASSMALSSPPHALLTSAASSPPVSPLDIPERPSACADDREIIHLHEQTQPPVQNRKGRCSC